MFDLKEFELASAKVFQAAFKIDALITKSGEVKQQWAVLACQGIAAGKLTMEQVKAQLIADYRGQVLKGDEQADFDVETAKIGDCGSTIKGWYYDLARVVEAGEGERVVKGEALTTVRRNTKPKQVQSGKGGGKPKATTNIPSLSASIGAVRHYISVAMADNSKANDLAANAELAALISDVAKLEAKVMANLEAATAPAKAA